MSKTYRISEIFYSIQGEGVRAGTPNVFVRFAGCNLKCNVDDEYSGFACDTEFTSGVDMTKDQIYDAVCSWSNYGCSNIIFTGGEPALQLDQELVDYFKPSPDEYPADQNWFLAIETNGTQPLPARLDWICVSPKSAEHALKVNQPINELKYVRNTTQAIPKPILTADNYLISPAFEPDGSVKRETLQHCIDLVKLNPVWQLSLQTHKLLGIR